MKRLLLVTMVTIVILGGFYFYEQTLLSPSQAPGESSYAPPARNPSSQTSIYNALPAPSSGTKQESSFSFPSGEFLSSLFKPRLNFLDTLEGPGAPPAPPQEQREGQQNENKTSPRDQTRGAIRAYLVSSSNLFPPELISQYLIGITKAHDGDTEPLISLRNTYRGKLRDLKTLTPPPELEEIHVWNVEAIEIHLALIGNIINGTYTSLKEIRTSPEAKEIEDIAKKTKREIFSVIEIYEVNLPPGVILY